MLHCALTVAPRLEAAVVTIAPRPRGGEVRPSFVLFAEMSREHSVPAALLLHDDARGQHVSVEGEGEGAGGRFDAA